MDEIDAYRIQQIVDNGNAVQISLIEDVQTEPLSQKQLIVENVAKKLDDDTKKQVMPLLEAILQAQPTIRVKSYAQTNISITMPKNRYEKMGRPQVGDKLEVDLKNLLTWFHNNSLVPNPKKFQFMILGTKSKKKLCLDINGLSTILSLIHI